MAYQPREGAGSLFKNDKAPNLRGTILLGGVLYELSGWTKEKDGGEKWISIAGRPKSAS